MFLIGDKEGDNALPKHVYANPDEPYLCPILAMAMYIFARGYSRTGAKNLLFGSGDHESSFSKWLRAFKTEHNNTLTALGIEISDIGTHSFRKGVATYVSGVPGI